MDDLKQKILDGTIKVFNQKGLKFTLDDVAKELGISKKTIYTVFENKDSLFLQMVDHCFDTIKESEQTIMNNPRLSIVDKIQEILGVMPESYRDIKFQNLYLLKDKYPKIYQRVEERLESGWETTISLLRIGMEEGSIRKVSIPLLKIMMEATLEQFFQRDVLVLNGISYQQALQEVVTILTEGIILPSESKREVE